MRPRAEAPCWAAPPVKIGEPVGAGGDPAPVPEGDPVPKGMLVRCCEDMRSSLNIPDGEAPPDGAGIPADGAGTTTDGAGVATAEDSQTVT